MSIHSLRIGLAVALVWPTLSLAAGAPTHATVTATLPKGFSLWAERYEVATHTKAPDGRHGAWGCTTYVDPKAKAPETGIVPIIRMRTLRASTAGGSGATLSAEVAEPVLDDASRCRWNLRSLIVQLATPDARLGRPRLFALSSGASVPPAPEHVQVRCHADAAKPSRLICTAKTPLPPKRPADPILTMRPPAAGVHIEIALDGPAIAPYVEHESEEARDLVWATRLAQEGTKLQTQCDAGKTAACEDLATIAADAPERALAAGTKGCKAGSKRACRAAADAAIRLGRIAAAEDAGRAACAGESTCGVLMELYERADKASELAELVAGYCEKHATYCAVDAMIARERDDDDRFARSASKACASGAADCADLARMLRDAGYSPAEICRPGAEPICKALTALTKS